MTMNHMTMNHTLWSRIHSKYLKSVFTKLKIFLNGPLIPRYDPFKTLYDVRFLIFLIPWSFPDYVFPDFGLEVLFLSLLPSIQVWIYLILEKWSNFDAYWISFWMILVNKSDKRSNKNIRKLSDKLVTCFEG